MDAGLQIFDAAGQIRVDYAKRIGKVLGILIVPEGQAGSLQVPDAARGVPFLVATYIGAYTTAALPFQPTFSGTTLSWSANSRPIMIVYGYY